MPDEANVLEGFPALPQCLLGRAMNFRHGPWNKATHLKERLLTRQ
jgi:hypothetical protein